VNRSDLWFLRIALASIMYWALLATYACGVGQFMSVI
jgi:hypothetical protein